MPKKNERIARIHDEKPLSLGMRGIVAYCDNRDKRFCKKCIIHGFHELTYINLICRPVDDYPEEYKNIEIRAKELYKQEDKKIGN